MGGNRSVHIKTHQYLLYFKAKNKINSNNNNISSVAEEPAATKYIYNVCIYVGNISIYKHYLQIYI